MSLRPTKPTLRSKGARLPRPLAIVAFIFASVLGPSVARDDLSVTSSSWVGAWATAPMAAPVRDEPVNLEGATLRQVIRVTLGGSRLRVRLSNAYGEQPLRVKGARIALARPGGAIDPDRNRPLAHAGAESFAIPPGGDLVTDRVDLSVSPLDELAISLHLDAVPETLTVHPGSRAHSYVKPGDALSSPTLPDANRVVRWYFITGVEVVPPNAGVSAVAILGDSITDGYGVTPDRYERWTDELARRFVAECPSAGLGILNLGIGGNRLLREGNGPSALSRLERDAFGHPGVQQLVVFLGVNDLGTRVEARAKKQDFASAADVIAGLSEIVQKARARGIRVIGATITPFDGNTNYRSADGEADRQAVNAWIRQRGNFDAVIDFDAILRDPADPSRLAAAYDSGDHLHPSIAGYTHMARAIDLRVFKP